MPGIITVALDRLSNWRHDTRRPLSGPRPMVYRTASGCTGSCFRRFRGVIDGIAVWLWHGCVLFSNTVARCYLVDRYENLILYISYEIVYIINASEVKITHGPACALF